ncbi:MAG: hypothetical protein U1G07_06425 [Verrucomicrobiota bacterium]
MLLLQATAPLRLAKSKLIYHHRRASRMIRGLFMQPGRTLIYRWLEQNDLDAQGRRYLLRQNIPGPTSDDHSRLIPQAQYARAADTQALLSCPVSQLSPWC